MNRRRQVLILESDEHLRTELEHALAGAGFDAVTTREFREAVNFLFSRDIDLVLVGDQPRPHCAGELLRLMRQMQCAPSRIALLPESTTEAEDLPRLGLTNGPEDPWCDEILELVGKQFVRRALTEAA
ncbi:MAG: hypothetical protein ABSD20_19650 [Terriglobales bacterium]|jgi:DNA-binding response OmpR family regulator